MGPARLATLIGKEENIKALQHGMLGLFLIYSKAEALQRINVVKMPFFSFSQFR
ncbi:hypothetical protein [Ligilactobacillus saerimneri]|uniref:hypothetical protein n=1 Tax=Ligilactobacillus saerimneri TaxID=228229 RepID=UPI0029426B63|nr:hypothetical protein [Ligilactobacillus saerimneri]